MKPLRDSCKEPRNVPKWRQLFAKPHGCHDNDERKNEEKENPVKNVQIRDGCSFCYSANVLRISGWSQKVGVFSRILIRNGHKSIIVMNSTDTRFSRNVFEAVQKTRSTCFIRSKHSSSFLNITYLTKFKDKNSLYYSADLAVLINVKFLGFNNKNKSATSIKCRG